MTVVYKLNHLHDLQAKQAELAQKRAEEAAKAGDSNASASPVKTAKPAMAATLQVSCTPPSQRGLVGSLQLVLLKQADGASTYHCYRTCKLSHTRILRYYDNSVILHRQLDPPHLPSCIQVAYKSRS